MNYNARLFSFLWTVGLNLFLAGAFSILLNFALNMLGLHQISWWACFAIWALWNMIIVVPFSACLGLYRTIKAQDIKLSIEYLDKLNGKQPINDKKSPPDDNMV